MGVPPLTPRLLALQFVPTCAARLSCQHRGGPRNVCGPTGCGSPLSQASDSSKTNDNRSRRNQSARRSCYRHLPSPPLATATRNANARGSGGGPAGVGRGQGQRGQQKISHLLEGQGHGSSLTAGGGASFGSPRCCPICLFIVNIVRGSSKSFPRESSRMMLRRSLGSCRLCSLM